MNSEPNQRIIGYVRVSTDEQRDSGAGLAAQRAAIAQEAHRRKWADADIDWFEDAGYSGKNLRRPGIAAALDALRHHEASTLVVAKVDRLSRSMVDFSGLMAKATKEGWALVALDLGVDTSTPTGEAMAHMVGTFAQLERRLISQRTRDALAIKRAEGVKLGRPRVLPDAVVARIVKERAEGRTLRAIADGLSSDGIPTAQGASRWAGATVRKVAISRGG